MHIAALGPVLVVPVGQGVHPRSVVSLGGEETNSSSTQSVQGVHAVALMVVVKPLVQWVQVLSVVGSPIIDKK